MQNIPYIIEIPEEETLLLPSFISTHTLRGPRREPIWVHAKDAVEALREKGVSTTAQTLFNMESRDLLHPRRLSPRNIQFDLHEVFSKFNLQ